MALSRFNSTAATLKSLMPVPCRELQRVAASFSSTTSSVLVIINLVAVKLMIKSDVVDVSVGFMLDSERARDQSFSGWIGTWLAASSILPCSTYIHWILGILSFEPGHISATI